MSRSKSAQANSPERRARWNSIDQLADLWGLSRARTRLVVRMLVRSGRMETRPADEAHREEEYRALSR